MTMSSHTIRSLHWVLGLVLGLAIATPTAFADPPSRTQVRQLLSGFETVPGADAWARLGPQTLGVLVALYADTSERPYVRLRAVSVAAFYPSPAARTFLLGVARAPRQGDLFVREAVLALGRAFGPRAVDDLRPFLTSPMPVVREATVAALTRIGTRPALDAVRRAPTPATAPRPAP